MNQLNKHWSWSWSIIFAVYINSSLAAPAPDAIEKKELIQQVDNNSAKQTVQNFQAELLAVMKKGKALGFKGRYKQLEVTIIKHHDLTKIARIVLGKNWRNLSDKQKLILSDVFIRLSVASYAFNFKDFSGESFVYLSEDTTARGGVIIHTMLKFSDGEKVKLDYYMLKKKGDNWRIINIIANGVSDLALKRSEYTSIMKREGFDALITKINEKINHYEKQ